MTTTPARHTARLVAAAAVVLFVVLAILVGACSNGEPPPQDQGAGAFETTTSRPGLLPPQINEPDPAPVLDDRVEPDEGAADTDIAEDVVDGLGAEDEARTVPEPERLCFDDVCLDRPADGAPAVVPEHILDHYHPPETEPDYDPPTDDATQNQPNPPTDDATQDQPDPPTDDATQNQPNPPTDDATQDQPDPPTDDATQDQPDPPTDDATQDQPDPPTDDATQDQPDPPTDDATQDQPDPPTDDATQDQPDPPTDDATQDQPDPPTDDATQDQPEPVIVDAAQPEPPTTTAALPEQVGEIVQLVLAPTDLDCDPDGGCYEPVHIEVGTVLLRPERPDSPARVMEIEIPHERHRLAVVWVCRYDPTGEVWLLLRYTADRDTGPDGLFRQGWFRIHRASLGDYHRPC